MNAIQRFQRNNIGRDFVVGDIHGMFDRLQELLDRVKFQPAADRLFSVGDLVDRGAQSGDVGEWLDKPWFHAVRGNHEEIAINYVAGIQGEDNYRRNGGSWFLAMTKAEQVRLARRFGALPVLFEIHTNDGVIGIVHADPVFDDWRELIRRIEEPHVQLCAVWSRDRHDAKVSTRVENIDAVIVGHCVVKAPLRLGNVFYIDTGAYRGGALTMIELGAMPTVHVQEMAVAA